MKNHIKDCPIRKHMPIGAFIIFLLSFIIFIYLLILDSKETNGDRSTQESIWIMLFFILLILCMTISGYCVVKSQQWNIAKKIDKNIDLLKDKFYSNIPEFKGNRIY